MRRSVAMFGAIVLGAAKIAAQQVPVTTLKPSNGALKEPLHAESLNDGVNFPRELRELSDGRVLVTDGMRTLLADFATGLMDVRRDLPGGGSLVALPGDSSIIIMPDGWHYLDRLRPVGMLPATNPLVILATGYDRIYGTDDRGHMLMQIPQKRFEDSIAVVLVDRVSGDRQVVAKLRPADPVPRGIFRPVCQMFERAVLASDGWMAVVRVNPYRVDWRSPNGKWTLGAPIPTPALPMTQREKDVYLKWREGERHQTPMDSIHSWPATVCPWIGFYSPIPTPDAKLVVYRVPTSEAPATRYDVIDRDGRVERQLAMPASDAILGFGRKSVFIVTTTSEDGTQTIRRHPWP